MVGQKEDSDNAYQKGPKQNQRSGADDTQLLRVQDHLDQKQTESEGSDTVK